MISTHSAVLTDRCSGLRGMKTWRTVIVVALLASSIHATKDDDASNEMCTGEKGNKVR